MSKKIKHSVKFDRNRKSAQNLAYKAEHCREKSHVNRIKGHLKRYGFNDEKACAELLRYAQQVNLSTLNSAKEFMRDRA